MINSLDLSMATYIEPITRSQCEQMQYNGNMHFRNMIVIPMLKRNDAVVTPVELAGSRNENGEQK